MEGGGASVKHRPGPQWLIKRDVTILQTCTSGIAMETVLPPAISMLGDPIGVFLTCEIPCGVGLGEDA